MLAVFNVSTFADTNDGGTESLREAIVASNNDYNLGGNVINLPAGTYFLTIAPVGGVEDNAIFFTDAESGDLDIFGNLTIVGAGAATTIIDATGLGDRVLHIAEGGQVNISGVTIRGGNATGGHQGGGLRIDIDINNETPAYVTIADSTIADNTADSGGGIYNVSGVLTITRSTISGNLATGDGGGIVSRNAGVFIITNSTGVTTNT